MGRAAVIVLALANLGYFAWSTGALAVLDLVPARLAAVEPQRLARQILPERLRIVTPEQAREEARARARAEVEARAQARLRARTREIRVTASATLAGSDAVIAESEPVVLTVEPAPPEASERSVAPAPAAPPASTAAARASEPSRPAAPAR